MLSGDLGVFFNPPWATGWFPEMWLPVMGATGSRCDPQGFAVAVLFLSAQLPSPRQSTYFSHLSALCGSIESASPVGTCFVFNPPSECTWETRGVCEHVPKVDGCSEATSRSVALGTVTTKFCNTIWRWLGSPWAKLMAWDGKALRRWQLLFLMHLFQSSDDA